VTRLLHTKQSSSDRQAYPVWQ